ncbi:MAG: glycoside hydrolase family 38 C-terminal domain-containing protein [Phototrophicales bacterium]|nr:glycoside hydrolase family 38 C-terminal domain-containing protein [Phototrophicales bacterium]
MTIEKSEGEKRTKPLNPQGGQSLATIYVIPHLRWERESDETFELRRAKLLTTLARLNEQMGMVPDTGILPMRSFLLSGQTVILEDIAAVRPDLVTLLVIYNAGGRLGIGPWYVLVDEALVSGESLVRNLLLARTNAAQYGLKLMAVGYSPLSSGHTAQLPQILRGFNMDVAFLRYNTNKPYVTHRWEAPNGSSILLINHDQNMLRFYPPETAETVAKHTDDQRKIRPNGPFLWLYDSGSSIRQLSDIVPEVTNKTGLSVNQSDLEKYARALRQEVPDNMRPILQGELRDQTLRENDFLFTGTLSTRMYLKQSNAQLQALLIGAVEPMLTIALTHGTITYPANLRALLGHTWRLLLKNQARSALGGISNDEVHQENEVNSRRIADNAQHIISESLWALGMSVHQPYVTHAPTDKTWVVVWNSQCWSRKQVMEYPLDLPTGTYPQRVLDDKGESQSFGWQPTTNTLSFLADVPAVGYAVYSIELGDTPPDEKLHGIRTTPGTVIGRIDGEMVSIQNNQVVWKRGETVITDLLRFYDGGDAGDAFNYSPPISDQIVLADLTNDVRVESSPLYERLILKHRMRLAPALKDDRTRERGLKLMEITTTITLYDHTSGVFFHTEYENVVKDHRLRAHLRTGLSADVVTCDAPFALVQRPVKIEGSAIPPLRAEGVTNCQPLQNSVTVSQDNRSLSLVARGLGEYEPIPEDDQVSIALTLVRSVGWLSRDDLQIRKCGITKKMPLHGAQVQRHMIADYALVPSPAKNPATILRTGIEFTGTLPVYQLDTPPSRLRRSFLSVVSDMATGADSDGEGAILTTIKPPERGQGWILRFYNPHEKPTELLITPFVRPVVERGELMTLSEEQEGFIDPDANGRMGVLVNPHEIVTLMLVFPQQG